jgi:hypothetical protein
LWGEEAVGREMRAVIGGSRTEVGEQDRWERKEGGAGREKEKASSKLMAEIEEDDEEDDEFGEWPLELDEERRIVQAVETPRNFGQAQVGGEFVTPRKRKWEEETLPTPVTRGLGGKKVERDGDIFTTPTKRLKQDSPSQAYSSPTATPTPTPSRSLSRSLSNSHELNPDSTPKPQQSYDITLEVLSLLHSQKIDESVKERLKEVLNKHALKISGVVKGRDISRVAIKKKDEKIRELEGVIARLEREREVDRVVIGHLKGDVRENVERRRGGRGRGRGRGRGGTG